MALQRAAGAAPAWQAILDRSTVHVDDITEDERWSELWAGARRRRCPSGRCWPSACSSTANPLLRWRCTPGAPRGFDADDVELTAAFAEHAAIAFNQAAQAEQIRNLRVALDHARIIGAALGIMMVGLNITQDQAFDRLRHGQSAPKSQAVRIGRRDRADGSIPALKRFRSVRSLARGT